MTKKFDIFTNQFSENIFRQKYSLDGQEKWSDMCRRVVDSVCGQLLSPDDKEAIYKYMLDRKFIPGGRYLYASGRPYHQINNCFLLRASDSREGWAELMADITSCLMTGGGIGVDYSALRPKGSKISRTGGESTGPIALMNMVNEAGRYVMQGGQRRSAIWAGLSWKHNDIFDFMKVKDWSPNVHSVKQSDFNFPAPMEGTNISVIYDTEFFVVMDNPTHELHQHARKIWDQNCLQAFSTAEPGFSINFLKDEESLRNACVVGDTELLTKNGYQRIDSLIDTETEIWNGFEWSLVTPKQTGVNQEVLKITLSDGRQITSTKYHTFKLADGYSNKSIDKSAEFLVLGDKLIKYSFPILETKDIKDIFDSTEDFYTQGFYSADGNKDSNIIWLYEPKYSILQHLNVKKIGSETTNQFGTKRIMCQMNFSNLPKNYIPNNQKLNNKLSWLSGLLDGDGTELIEGGCQIVSIDKDFLSELQKFISTLGVNTKVIEANEAGYRSLPNGYGGYSQYWCKETNRLCIGANGVQDLVSLGLNCHRLKFDKSPNRDASRFVQIIKIESAGIAPKVFCFNEPKRHTGCFNGIITGQCTEVVSADNSDKCNLGTVWINRFKTRDDFAKCCKYAVKFLMCGGIYSDVPTEKVREVGNRNNRIGLGLGGIHEWLMIKGSGYEVTPELHKWLNVYEMESNSAAFICAKELGVAIPKGIRAIAPTGCQRGDTLIVTEEGILELSELGDTTGEKWQNLNINVSQETNEDSLSNKFYINGYQKTKQINLSSGQELECTFNHRYRILENEEYIWKRADELKINDLLIVKLGGYKKQSNPILFDVPKQHKLEILPNFPKIITNKLAEFLGIFFADGSMHERGIRISCNAKESDYKYIAKLGEEIFNIKPTLENNKRNCMDVCFNSVPLLRWLYINNFNKPYSSIMQLPAVIRSFSVDALTFFLNGYWFGDGSINQNTKYIDTSSQKFARQLLTIYRALGNDAAIQNNVSGFGSKMYRVRLIKTKSKNETQETTKQLKKLNLKNCTVDKIIGIKNSKCHTYDISVPDTKTYIANGVVSHNTIGILAETTTGIEPLFCKAYKRRYLKGSEWHYEHVVDGAVKRLIELGVPIEVIQDSYDISFKERVKFQADVQNYVDMSISSTCNIAPWGSETNNEKTLIKNSEILLKYAKRLRGFTCYPDGARGGQPLTRMSVEDALKNEGVIYEEKEHECHGGVCGV